MHASSPQESSEAARRLGSAEVTFRYVEMRHCMMYNMLRLTGSLPRGNCVLRWPSQLRHVRKRYFLASKSRPRLPVSHTRGWQWRFDIDATFSDGNAYARKHLRFRFWQLTYVDFTMIYESSKARCLCHPIEKELPQCNWSYIIVNRATRNKSDFFIIEISYCDNQFRSYNMRFL